ncbi:MAG: DUF5667 domain-containing protein [Candidatus Limnocylindria bacterium]|nr:DUF5667 domain-containing protein [Candidatus Limnocylindria bacterium]
MGQDSQKRLDQLIQQVSRGERELSSIRDAGLREAVRLALRLHKEAPAAPDAYARMRMRARVLSGLRPHRPTLADHAWTALWHLGRPAPYIVRSVALAALLAAAGLGATVASADTLPDDLLYPLKLASESLRLTLAGAAEDRAAVEISIAEHRLAEAERLAAAGRTSDALVASAIYSQHMASAAAELAPQADSPGLGAQLESRFNAQRDRARALATTLSVDVKSARGAQVLALIASPTLAPGRTGVERIAETAASLAGDIADAAENDESDANDANDNDTSETNDTGRVRASRSPKASPSARAANASARPTETAKASATARRTEASEADRATTRPTSTATPPARRSVDQRISDAAKATRKAAEEARAAADKLKQILKDNADKARDKEQGKGR